MERIFPFCQCFDIGAKEAKHCRVIQKDSIWGTTYLPKWNRSMHLMKLEHYSIRTTYNVLLYSIVLLPQKNV